MGEEITFYTNPMSRGRIARWMLEEVGQPYRHRLPRLRPADEHARLPRAEPDGQGADASSTARPSSPSARRSAPTSPTPSPRPASPPSRRARGAYYRWLFFAAGPLEAAVTNQALGVEVPDERRGMVGYGAFGRVMDALETAVAGGGYIAGDRFSAADVYVGSQIGFGLRFGTIEDAPGLPRLLGAPRRPPGGGPRPRRSTTPPCRQGAPEGGAHDRRA